LTYDAWWKNLRAGQVVVTNGPLIRDPRLNGELPGHVFRADAGQTVQLQATLNLSIRETVDYLEIVKDGAVVHQVRLQDWADSGGRLPLVEFDRSGWILVRAVTSNPKTYRLASTGPWYVEVAGQRRISRKAAQFFFDWVYERARASNCPKARSGTKYSNTTERPRLLAANVERGQCGLGGCQGYTSPKRFLNPSPFPPPFQIFLSLFRSGGLTRFGLLDIVITHLLTHSTQRGSR